MSKIILIVVIAALIGGGIYFVLGKGSVQHGKSIPAGLVTSISDISSHGKAWVGKEVTVKGRMTQKCPTSGCWFYVKDSTGEIRVDTAPSGFTITDIPLGKTITVHGKVVVTEGGTELVATGVKA